MASEKQERINQWFIRGIALIVSSLLCTIFFFTFATFDQNQFYSEPASFESNYSTLAQEIGRNLWTVRVFDLLLIFAIILLTIISIYNLTNFNVVRQTSTREHRRFE